VQVRVAGLTVLGVVLGCAWVALVGVGVVMTARASYGMWDFAAALTIGDIEEARRGLPPACVVLAAATASAVLLSRTWWGPACLAGALAITYVNWNISADYRNAGWALYSVPVVALLALAGVILTLVTPRSWLPWVQ
jgi:hypothetical protein